MSNHAEQPPIKPFLTDHSQILEWLDKYCEITGDVTISPECFVSVDGDIRFRLIARVEIPHLAVQFENVTGYFSCSNCEKLTSLIGSPTTVGGDFHCYQCNNLKDLIGSPQYVGGNFYAYQCKKLISLEGAPKNIGGNLTCTYCPRLVSLDDFRKAGGHVAFTKMGKPEPAVIRNLLRQRTELVTAQQAKWISIVNDYHNSGDLLTAIAQFEKYYKVPFSATPDVNAPTPLEIPHL